MPYMYILECADGSYYTGSTWNLELRLWQHQNGEGANFTKKRLPVKLVFYDSFDRVEDAYRREKQVQGWSRRKKKALIEANYDKLVEFSRNYTEYGKPLPEPVEGSSESSLVDPASTGSACVEYTPLPELVEGSSESSLVDPASTGSACVEYTPLPELVEGSGADGRGGTAESADSGESGESGNRR